MLPLKTGIKSMKKDKREKLNKVIRQNLTLFSLVTGSCLSCCGMVSSKVSSGDNLLRNRGIPCIIFSVDNE